MIGNNIFYHLTSKNSVVQNVSCKVIYDNIKTNTDTLFLKLVLVKKI